MNLTLLEDKLKCYKKIQEQKPLPEDKLVQTIQLSKNIFYEAEAKQNTSYFEFLWEQAAYIKKCWWALQLAALICFAFILLTTGQSDEIKRNMGVMTSLFVIIMIPEFWKSKNSGCLEVESSTYYSLHQIYAARMCLFAIVDTLILTLFCTTITLATQITFGDMLTQFFLPFNVNCCICCRILCGKKYNSEYVAVSLCMIWGAIWTFIIWNKQIFETISKPVWISILLFSILYLIFSIQKLMKNCDQYWEVNPSWN